MAKDGKGKVVTHIELMDGYCIAVDHYSYELRKKMGKTYRAIAYCSSLDKALETCRKEYVRSELMKNETLTLDEAVSIVVHSNNHVASLIKNAFEGVES